MSDELSEFLKYYKLHQYKTALNDAGADDLGDLRDLDDDECASIADEAKFKTLHKKKFINACKELRDDKYNPTQKNNDINEQKDINNIHLSNSKYGNLNFQTKLPLINHKNQNLENKITEYLSDNGSYYKKWGDPLLVILRGNWIKEIFKTNDKIEFEKRFSSSSNVQADIIKGKTYIYYFLKVSVVAFNQDQKDNKCKLCNLTTFFIQSNQPNNDGNGWLNYTNLEHKQFDPRQLNDNLYNKCITKYGKDLITKAFLKSSDISKNECKLIENMNEIKRLFSKGLAGRKQKEHVDAVKQLIENGADPNLIIDDHEYRVLHYARYLNGSDYFVPFVKWVCSHGGDPNLGPIHITKCFGSGGKVDKKYHITPWYFYQEQNIMLKNGPLHNAIGGQCGGIMCDHGLVKFYTKQSSFKCDKCLDKQNKNTLLFGCRKCDYDLCSKCYNKNPLKLQKPEIPPPDTTVAKCTANHGLIKRSMNKRHSNCNQCSEAIKPMSIVYACAQCDYYLCVKCAIAINIKIKGAITFTDCSGKHGLVKDKVSAYNMLCGSCKNKMPLFAILYGCAECKFAVCSNCFVQHENDDDDPVAVVANCVGNHGLIKSSATNSRYSCDKCKNRIKYKDIMHSCRKCNYDLCDQCYSPIVDTSITSNNDISSVSTSDPVVPPVAVQNPVVVSVVVANCPSNHGLVQFNTPGSSYSCDKCKNRMKYKDIMYGCRKCNYDLCGKCYLPKDNNTQNKTINNTSTDIKQDKPDKNVSSIVDNDDINVYDEIKKLKKKQNESDNMIIELKNIIIKLQKKQTELENKIIGLQNDKLKNVKNDIDDDKKDNLQLNLVDFDIKLWKVWKAKQLVSWIISLNKIKYGKYYQSLSSKMTASNVTPLRLNKTGKGSLGYYGISNNEDKSDIWNEFQKLITS